MAYLNRECIICGKKYRYCEKCTEFKGVPIWHVEFCGENCKGIYDLCVGYIHEEIKKEDASKKAKELDLTYLDNIEDSAKKTIKEIIREDKKTENKK